MQGIAQDPTYQAPLPLGVFKRFVAAFHLIFLFGLVLSLTLRYRRPGFAWSEEDYVLLGVVAAQAGAYWLFMIRQWKGPEAIYWWFGYFAFGYATWLLQWHIEGSLQWTAWAFLGQMFGVLPPRFSVPGALIFFGTYFGVGFGFGDMKSSWEYAGALSLVVSIALLGSFLYKLTTTSMERARLIQKLELAQAELERAKERDAEYAALKERERLARELHDSLGHGLVTLTVQLEAAQRLMQVDSQRASALMDEMKSLTRSSMEQLRRALAGLRTPGLGDRDLFGALRELCDSVQRDGIKVSLVVPGEVERLAPGLSEAIWRIAQEGLTNVQKHARASNARVELTLRDRQLTIRVSDDGVGVPPSAENQPGHFGLRGVRERVEGLGGTLTVRVLEPHGTELEARLPRISS